MPCFDQTPYDGATLNVDAIFLSCFNLANFKATFERLLASFEYSERFRQILIHNK